MSKFSEPGEYSTTNRVRKCWLPLEISLSWLWYQCLNVVWRLYINETFFRVGSRLVPRLNFQDFTICTLDQMSNLFHIQLLFISEQSLICQDVRWVATKKLIRPCCQKTVFQDESQSNENYGNEKKEHLQEEGIKYLGNYAEWKCIHYSFFCHPFEEFRSLFVW